MSIRDKGMYGWYEFDGKRCYVSAYWDRPTIEGTHLFPRLEDRDLLKTFQEWLKDNGYKYQFEKRT